MSLVLDKCIAALDSHTGNSNSNSNHLSIIKNIKYKYKNCKRPADDWTEKHMEIIYCHSGDSTTWPAATYAAPNYGLRKQSTKSDGDKPTDRWT